MSFKVLGGTRPDKRLCDSCKWGTIRCGPQQGQEAVHCALLPITINPVPKSGIMGFFVAGNVPFPVVECSSYRDKKAMDEIEMQRIGWVLETRGSQVIGFRRPEKGK